MGYIYVHLYIKIYVYLFIYTYRLSASCNSSIFSEFAFLCTRLPLVIHVTPALPWRDLTSMDIWSDGHLGQRGDWKAAVWPECSLPAWSTEMFWLGQKISFHGKGYANLNIYTMLWYVVQLVWWESGVVAQPMFFRLGIFHRQLISSSSPSKLGKHSADLVKVLYLNLIDDICCQSKDFKGMSS